jgi:hypothetical protein
MVKGVGVASMQKNVSFSRDFRKPQSLRFVPFYRDFNC